MLYTQIDIGSGLTLHLINLHFKSKLASNIPGRKIDSFTWRTVSAWAEGSFISSMKRLGQALQARLLIDEIFDTHGPGSLIAMAGDFNAQTDEVPIKAVCGPVEETGNPAHAARMMVPCENNIPDSTRYSLFHLGKGQMLDHIIVSRPLLRYFRGAEIHNEERCRMNPESLQAGHQISGVRPRSGGGSVQFRLIQGCLIRHLSRRGLTPNADRLPDNDFGKAKRGRCIGYTPASDNAAKIFIWKSILSHNRRQDEVPHGQSANG